MNKSLHRIVRFGTEIDLLRLIGQSRLHSRVMAIRTRLTGGHDTDMSDMI